MQYTRKFIEDAIAGGYQIDESIPNHPSNLHRILLDPTAWVAVGNTRNWTPNGTDAPYWPKRQIAFIQQLQDGKTIEQALEAITNQ